MIQICDSDDSTLYKQILALIATVFEPITLLELTSLVEALEDMSDDIESLQQIIGLCGSFLTVRHNTIYFVHQSAKDYLVEKAPAEIFPCGMGETHHEIFSRSLKVLSRTLRKDIYGLRRPGYPIEQVQQPDPDLLASSRYSCLYWVDHLCDQESLDYPEGKVDLRDGGSVDLFVREKYLYWLEALSLSKAMSTGVLAIVNLEKLVQVISDVVIA